MDSDKLFGSYIKTDDVKEPVETEIVGVKIGTFGSEHDSEQKLLVSFKGFDKPLVLNKANQESIKAIVGSAETDDWIGAKMVLFTDPNVMYGGKRVGGVRVRGVEDA